MQGMQVPNRAHFPNLTLSVKFGHKSSDQRRLGFSGVNLIQRKIPANLKV